ncbi:hypothetical protein [Pantoea sp. Ae16]|uniref:hypothetical protein n=1 Tax=Pantoea sp. Ae16 TaxID=1890373 RepID=UPI0008FD752E|nr:hypothetical protein [Pantoea sp. Ae16]OIX90659.1 hypothetical protein BFS13_10805 [Pantoea sp. Ae16]
MITKRMIDEDVDNVREMLRKHDFVIPGIWTVVWPVLIFFIFVVGMQMIFCIEFDPEVIKARENDSFAKTRDDFSVYFVGMVAFIAAMGVLNGRARYLCLPEVVREKSLIVRFIRRKVMIYIIIWMTIFLGTGICVLLSPDVTSEDSESSLFYGFIILFFLFNIDMARFELSALNKLYDLWKENKL